MNRFIKYATDKGKDKAKDLGVLLVLLLVLFVLNGCQLEEQDTSSIIRMFLF